MAGQGPALPGSLGLAFEHRVAARGRIDPSLLGLPDRSEQVNPYGIYESPKDTRTGYRPLRDPQV